MLAKRPTKRQKRTAEAAQKALDEMRATECASRRPLPPDALVDALPDRVHPASGRLIDTKLIKRLREHVERQSDAVGGASGPYHQGDLLDRLGCKPCVLGEPIDGILVIDDPIKPI